jgi:hypothetical protein
MQNSHEVQGTQTESEIKEKNAIRKDMQHNDYLESNITFQYEDVRLNVNTKRIGRLGIEHNIKSMVVKKEYEMR